MTSKKLQPTPEPRLIEQASAEHNSPTRFEETAFIHRDDLLAGAMRLCRNRSDAEDLVQDTFTRALGAWKRFEAGTNAKAWLFRIMTNSFINGYRRKTRQRRFTEEHPRESREAVHGVEHQKAATPKDALVDEAFADEVSAALNELGDEYRQVVELADLRGKRYKDIAQLLNVPMGTVMSRLYRARRKLEEELREYAAQNYGIRRAAA